MNRITHIECKNARGEKCLEEGRVYRVERTGYIGDVPMYAIEGMPGVAGFARLFLASRFEAHCLDASRIRQLYALLGENAR